MDMMSDMDDSVRAALSPLAEEQQKVVDLIGDVYFKHDGSWPTFQFVEAAFDSERLDVRSVISSLPMVGGLGIRYGAIASISWIGNVQRNQPVELTALGLHHYSGAFWSSTETVLRDLFSVLALFLDTRRSFQPSPLEYTPLELTSAQVFAALSAARSDPTDVRHLYRIMEHEPGFLGGSRGSNSEASSWTWGVEREVLSYDGVTDIESYVHRIAERYGSHQPVRNLALASPRTLPAALDYLDTVWRLAHGRAAHLVRLASAERTMLLGFGASSREEFLERTGTLGDILKSLAVPPGGDQRGGHALERLGPYLRSKLAPESHERVDRAIKMLDRVRRIRNAGGHVEAQAGAVAAYRGIGVDYPVTDWSGAWEAVCGHAVEALDALRQEVAILTETVEGEG